MNEATRAYLLSDLGSVQAASKMVRKYLDDMCAKAKKNQFAKDAKVVKKSGLSRYTGLVSQSELVKVHCACDKGNGCDKIVKMNVPKSLVSTMAGYWNNGSRITTVNNIERDKPNAHNHMIASSENLDDTWFKY